MAWSFDGITKAQFDTGAGLGAKPTQMIATPLLIKKITVLTDSNTAAEVLHGETTFPDIVVCNINAADPDGAATIAAYSGSTAAYIAFDVGRNGAVSFDAYLIWLKQAAGGIS